jgi:hypothetical protein
VASGVADVCESEARIAGGAVVVVGGSGEEQGLRPAAEDVDGLEDVCTDAVVAV